MTDTKPLDLADLNTTAAADKGFELELLHPVSKAALGVFVGLVGKDSTAFRDHIRRSANERLRKQAMQQRRGKEIEVLTMERIEADAIELLAVSTTGWRGVTYKGEDLPFSAANARLLYTEMTWVREQIDEAIGDLENFMPG